MKTPIEILERAVINLTMENAQLKEELKEKEQDLKGSRESSTFWYDKYNALNKALEEANEKHLKELASDEAN